MSPSPKPSEAAENPDSPTTPSPEPTPPPAVPVGSLFLPPKGAPAPYPPPSPSSSTSPASPSSSPRDDDAAVPTWSADSGASEATSGPSSSSDTPSTPGSGLVSRAGLRQVFAGAVKTVTNMLAAVAADATQQAYGLWRAEQEDIEGVSEPAARIAYRHLPEEARNSDALDLFGLGLALAAYIGKNLKLRAELRALAAGGQLVEPPAGTTVTFVPSGDRQADAAAAEAWGISKFGGQAAAAAAAP